MQRRFAIVVVLGIDLGVVGQQQFHHVFAPFPHRQIQRRLIIFVLGIDLGLTGKEQFDHARVATNRRNMQGRPAIGI